MYDDGYRVRRLPRSALDKTLQDPVPLSPTVFCFFLLRYIPNDCDDHDVGECNNGGDGDQHLQQEHQGQAGAALAQSGRAGLDLPSPQDVTWHGETGQHHQTGEIL